METVNNVPKLRFPEFEKNLELKALSDITKINQGLQIPISERQNTKTENNLFYITNEFLKAGSNKKYFIETPPKSVVCDDDDILMTRTGNTGQVVTGVSGVFHNNFFRIKYSDEVAKDYLYYFLTSYKTQSLILRLAGTSTIPDLNHGDFYKININLPSKNEQQKIASFLTEVDNKIEQVTKKKQLLSDYKKGVMQQIFSQQIRFKQDDGRAFPDWEVKQLSSLGKWFGGGTPETTKPEYWNGNIQWFTPTELKTKYVRQSKRRITAMGLQKSSAKLLPIGTVLLSTRATVGDVSIALEECTTNQGFQSLVVSLKHSNEFAYYFLHVHKKEIIRRSSGSTFLEISKSELSKIKLPMPILKEQQKIANFLTDIDTKINLVNKQLEGTKQFKQGLLQQMFV